jgi:hypothetical protein
MNMFVKKKLIELPFVYTANVLYWENQTYIGVGSERESPVYLINLNDNSVLKVADGIGGTMSLVHVPDSNPIQLFSVMGLFPSFKGLNAGVYRHTLINGSWVTEKIFSLPFAHRCEIINIDGKNHLFIATVSKHKSDPSDWSLPGELHHIMIDNIENLHGEPQIIINNLFKNHGMIKTKIEGRESVCVSGVEGIFAIQSRKGNWEVIQLFDKEVSEFSFFDFDNDGEDELVVIEPFHGNKMSIYKKIVSKWRKLYDSPLSFGHGISAGRFKNQQIIVVGNREGTEALEMHVVSGLDKINKIIIEEHVGATQTKVFNHKGVDYILSANEIKNEVVLYS